MLGLGYHRGDGSAAAQSAFVIRQGADASPESFSDLVGAIYDCALDPRQWAPTLARVDSLFSFASAALGVVHLRGPHLINAAAGYDAEWLAAAESYAPECVALLGGEERVSRFPLDEPILASESSGYAGRDANRFFVEILRPRGIFDGAHVTLASGPTLMAYALFNRHLSAGEISQSEVAALRLLGPHFRRAVTIGNLFDLKAIDASTFASTLDVFAFGVILVREGARIVHANAAARSMLAAREPVRSDRGVLNLSSATSNTALERSISQALNDESAMGARGIAIPVRPTAGAPCLVHVLPLRRGEIRRGVDPQAAAAVFIAPSSAPGKAAAEGVALLYDLTPAETRIFELITAGMTPAQAGEHLGIARSTVKTHLLRLFEKTGCKRQADLGRLAASLSLPT
jgi:DNA-binding CsgD family transcriptional regulator